MIKNININLLLIFLSIVSFPFNYKLILFLRPQDLFVIILIFVNFYIFKKKDIILLFIIFSLLTLSNIIGYLQSNELYVIKFAFYYKFLIPVIFTIILIRGDYINKYFKEILFAVYFSFGISLIYIITFYFFTPLFNLPIKWFINLPHYPGFLLLNSSNAAGDRHLYSALVYLFLIFNLSRIVNSKITISYSIIFITLILILIYVLQSRTFMLGTIFIIIFSLVQYLNLSLKISRRSKVLLISLGLFIFTFLFILNFKFISYEFSILTKYLTYNYSIPLIHGDRAFNWLLYDAEIVNVFFGSGFLSKNQIFYDNGFLPIFFGFGFFGIGIILFYLKKFYKIIYNYSLSNYAIITSIFINFLGGEFYLVSRYIFVAIIIILLLSNSSVPKKKQY